MVPQSHPPDRKAAVDRLKAALGKRNNASVVWLSDGIDHGQAGAFIEAMSELAGNGFTVVETGDGDEALGVLATVGKGGRLDADVVRAHGGAREGLVLALSSRGERLGESRFKLTPGENRTVPWSSKVPIPSCTCGAQWSPVRVITSCSTSRKVPA